MLEIILFSSIFFVTGILLGCCVTIHKNQVLTRKQLNTKLNKVLTKYIKQSNDKIYDNSIKIVLLLINLDEFNSVVEAFGYNTSNSILNHTKNKIADHAKQQGAIFYNSSYDEYAILYENKLFENTQIINVANQLLELISEPIWQEHHEIHVTASIGISIFPDYAQNSERLLRCAELAVINAKNAGRNNFQFYHQATINQAIDRAKIRTDLLAALSKNELELYWQPQVMSDTRKLVGAEVLVRWHHIYRGAVSPEVFISIAEQTGLIWKVGVWIIQNACLQGKKIIDQVGLTDFRVAINLSSGQFLQNDVVEVIADAIYASGIKPENVEVELTESMFLTNPEKCMLMISVLTSMGIKIAIDDFGTGYSSFSRLRQLNWHYLKIDQSFIKNIDTNRENTAIVAAIIAMAKSLGIRVIAEGIESEKELAVLQKVHCDIIQGYHISKPLPLNDFIDFAANNKQ
jgi:diguanylate cyclase (GGDEF)-like protein